MKPVGHRHRLHSHVFPQFYGTVLRLWLFQTTAKTVNLAGKQRLRAVTWIKPNALGILYERISIQSPLHSALAAASLMSSWISAPRIGNEVFGVFTWAITNNVVTPPGVSFRLFQQAECVYCELYMCVFSLRLSVLIDRVSSRVQSGDPRGSRSLLRFNQPASPHHHLTPSSQVQIFHFFSASC